MSKFVRQSKYKHVVGTIQKKELWYPDINASSASSDYNGIAASATNVAVAGSTNGSVYVLPLSLVGKRSVASLPTIHAHGVAITDMQWSRFDDRVLCTAADDGSIKVWQVPDSLEDLTLSISESKAKLTGHKKRVETVKWHPSALNILASGSAEKTVKIWDVSQEKDVLSIDCAQDALHSLDWNYEGSLVATVSKDKKVRILDPRSKSVVAEAEAHQGIKPSRVVWLGQMNRIMTTGFNKNRGREFFIWDCRSVSKPIKSNQVDTGTGVLEPLFDCDTSLLFLTGHGDSSIQCLEMEENDSDNFYPLTKVMSDQPQRSTCMVSKRGVELMDAEIVRILKLTNKEVIPVSFAVPRRVKSEFQADLYPDTASTEPALKSGEWLSGSNKPPKLMVLRPGVNTKRFWIDETDQTQVPTLSEVSTPSHSSTSTSSPTPKNTPSIKESPSEPKTPTYVAKEVKVVRSSKFRHIVGKVSQRREDNYDALRINVGANSSMIKCNPTYFCVPWEGNGGRVAVIPLSRTGRQPEKMPFVECGSDVLDFDFNPFDDSILATTAENGRLQIWKIPQGGLTETTTQATSNLIGHRRRTPSVDFHPNAANIVVTTSADNTIKLWDLAAEKEALSLEGFINDPVTSIGWDWNGSLMAVAVRDKKMRIFDVRAKKLTGETEAHENPKGFKLTWMGREDKIITVGATQRSERTLALWDIRNMSSPSTTKIIDIGASVITPYYDMDTGVIFTPGKGDGNIKMFELDQGSFEYLTEYQSSLPAAGLAIFPKRSNNVMDAEIDRFIKLAKDHALVIHFSVPRTRKELFQDDLFPDTRDTGTPALTSSQWLGGQSKPLAMVSLRPPNVATLSENPVEKTGPKYQFDPNSKDKEWSKEKFLGAYHQNLSQHSESSGQKLSQDLLQGANSDEWD